jgi:hypothetical protein
MTRLTTSAGLVALVQTALMLPLMLVSVPAGAIADTRPAQHAWMSLLAYQPL